MMPYEKTDLQRIYGSDYIDQKAPGFYPVEVNKKRSPVKSFFILDSALLYLQERLSIDTVIKELSFAFVAIITYIYMQNSGRVAALDGFGNLIALTLIAAMAYNLFKASMKSLAPGVICLVGGLVLVSTNIHHQYFKFLSVDMINYIIGTGAFFIGLSLFKSGND